MSMPKPTSDILQEGSSSPMKSFIGDLLITSTMEVNEFFDYIPQCTISLRHSDAS